MINWLYADDLIINALKEDIGYGDITTDLLIDPDQISKGRFIVKSGGIIAGLDVAKRVFHLIDGETDFLYKKVKDGEWVEKGTIIAEIDGRTASILKGERVALNILQRMSGIATQTFEITSKVKDTKVKIVDTRKTLPGFRMLDKYSVLMGGGSNHRINLSDMILIKDNHIKAVGSIGDAVRKAKAKASFALKVEVEVETLDELKEALEAKADIIMLDNMPCEMMKQAVDITSGRAILEASGNINIDNVLDVANTGVDIISIGSLTHSVEALDISLKFK